MSEWTTGELTQTIDRALDGVEGPALRLGVGIRLFLAKAEEDPVWCRFVVRVWKLGWRAGSVSFCQLRPGSRRS